MTYLGMLGWYVNCDDAVCAGCAPEGFTRGDYSGWGGSWESPATIWDDGASDTPTHCGTCGQLIPHPLTADGYDYVGESLERALRDGDIGAAIGAWMDAYGDDVDVPASYLDPFVAGYCQAMLFAHLSDVRDTEGTGHDAQPSDWQTPADGWQLEAFTLDSQRLITEECADFVRGNWRDLAGLHSHDYGWHDNGTPSGDPDVVAASAGHDFALTRNGHGTGFWDRGLGDLGQSLTTACEPYGTSGAWFDSRAHEEGRAVCWLDDASDAPEISD